MKTDFLLLLPCPDEMFEWCYAPNLGTQVSRQSCPYECSLCVQSRVNNWMEGNDMEVRMAVNDKTMNKLSPNWDSNFVPT